MQFVKIVCCLLSCCFLVICLLLCNSKRMRFNHNFSNYVPLEIDRQPPIKKKERKSNQTRFCQVRKQELRLIGINRNLRMWSHQTSRVSKGILSWSQSCFCSIGAQVEKVSQGVLTYLVFSDLFRIVVVGIFR